MVHRDPVTGRWPPGLRPSARSARLRRRWSISCARLRLRCRVHDRLTLIHALPTLGRVIHRLNLGGWVVIPRTGRIRCVGFPGSVEQYMKRSAAITTLMVTLGLLSACTPEADPTPSPTPSATSAAPTPTPSETPTSASPEPSPSPSPSETLNADQQAARDVVNEFFRLSNELAQNPDLPLQPLADITTGETQHLYVGALADYREMNAIQVGDISWEVMNIGPVDNRAGEKVVLLEVCSDASSSDIVDRETRESILPDDRTPIVGWVIEAVAPSDIWLVGNLTNDLDCT